MARIVPHIVHDQLITGVTLGTSVRQAAEIMAARHIAAVVVLEGRTLAGIMTERDITVRVVARGLDPRLATVGEVMTPDPDTLSPDDSPETALRMMQEHNYRHLPVKSVDGAVVGMVSVRDLYAFVQSELENGIKARDTYISGESYGVSA